MTNTPILQNRDRALSVSVFRKEKDGRTYYGVCLQRSYKQGEEWKREQINLFPEDLLKIANLSTKAYNDILDLPPVEKSSEPDGEYIPF